MDKRKMSVRQLIRMDSEREEGERGLRGQSAK